ncbi:MAG: ADP-forming succinate--CoA ligase subunit beta [Peptococcaceae bacterium]|nr:ADP-forming succinate--CoA ligase subunit beta [Candidatus Syntrophopropionicum ammoniitolerans]
MKLFEYMGKELFAKYGIPTPQGRMAKTPEEAEKIAAEIGGPCVVKSQVLSGKRGKAGGIKFPNTPEEAKKAAEEVLGMTIQGLPVECVLVEEKLKIDKELYMSITIDGSAKQAVMIASAYGGMEIEAQPEEYIIKRHIDPELGMLPFFARDIVNRMGFGLRSEHGKQMIGIIQTLYKICKEKDAELVEINPLVFSDDKVMAADSKVTIDDDAMFRMKDIPFVDDKSPAERAAADLGLSFVELEGDIAVMANGAGITMGTLDTLQVFGGTPRNFLDCGGGTGREATAKALDILLGLEPKGLFVNIFGGITRCDDVANAVKDVYEARGGFPVPLVIRLVGTNQDAGREILKSIGVEAFDFMEDAARRIIELVK